MKHKIEIKRLTAATLPQSDAPLSNKNVYIIEKNPFKEQGDVEEVLKIEGRFDGVLAGEIYPFPSKILVDGRVVDVTSGSNYWVAEKYRKYDFGIGILEDYFALDQTFILGMVSGQAKPIYEHMGFKVVEFPRYIVLRKVNKILRKHLNAWLTSVLSLLTNAALLLKELAYSLYVKVKYRQYTVVEKNIDNINYDAVEQVILNSPHKYKEYHNRDWIKFVLNYQANNGGYHKFFEIYRGQEFVGFFMQQVRNYGESDGWKNFNYGSLIEWGSVSISEKDLFAMASESFSDDVDAILLANIDASLVKSIPLLGAIRNGVVNYAVKNDNPAFSDIMDWSKWRIRVAGGDNII